MKPVITVTGSTGTIGRELVRLLSAAKADTRAIHRHSSALSNLPHVTWVNRDLDDTVQLDSALQGTTHLFLLTVE
jgi:uncharacterized protein YbjT (DUF2867 family)